jgi:hypothetical protein
MPGDFCQVSPAPANDLRAVWGSGPNDVWAVGVRGTILHYDGRAWRRVESGITEDLSGVSGTSSDDVWIVGSAGTVLHYDGSSFDAGLGPGTALELHDVAAADGAVWIAASEELPYSENAAVFHFDGFVWGAWDPAGDAFNDYFGVFANAWHDVWVTGVETFHFDGLEWQTIANMPGNDVWASPYGRAWTVSDLFLFSSYYFSGGVPLTEVQATNLRGIWGFSEEDIWAVAGDGQIFHRTEGGWTQEPTPASHDLYDVWGSSPSDAWIVGDGATILHYDGRQWSVANSADTGTDVTYTGIWGATDGEQWIVGKPGVVSRFDGVSLPVDVPVSGGDALPYAAIAGIARDDIVAVGVNGRIAEFDGGEWATTDPLVTSDLRAVWAGSRKVMAVGDNKVVMQRGAPHSWGVDFGPEPEGLSYETIWGSSDDSFWVGGDAGVIRFLDSMWYLALPIAARPQALWGSAPNDVWSISSDGLDYFNGEYWEPQPSLQPSLEVTPFHGATGCSASDVWAVGDGGQIYHYDGSEWSRIESGTTNDLRGVRCSPGGVWVVGEGGIILRRNADE